MDRSRTRTVRRFAERLQAVVDETVSEAKAVEYEFTNSRRTTVAEKQKVVQQLQEDLNEADSTINTLVSISQVAPAALQLMHFGFARVSLIDEILDAFERRLQSEFGIQPVSVALAENEPLSGTNSETNGSGVARSHVHLDMPVTPVAQQTALEVSAAPKSRMFTPQAMKRREPDSLLNVSKTPRMEDFGIDADKVRELQEQSNSFLHGSTGRFGTGPSGVGCDQSMVDGTTSMSVNAYDWREGNYPQDVQRSMRELGIETNQEVSERFHTRRNLALQNVMQSCTPQLKSGTTPRMDFTRFAAGYAGSNVARGDGRASRELNFDEDE